MALIAMLFSLVFEPKLEVQTDAGPQAGSCMKPPSWSQRAEALGAGWADVRLKFTSRRTMTQELRNIRSAERRRAVLSYVTYSREEFSAAIHFEGR
jgi:hypothetical protein